MGDINYSPSQFNLDEPLGCFAKTVPCVCMTAFRRVSTELRLKPELETLVLKCDLLNLLRAQANVQNLDDECKEHGEVNVALVQMSPQAFGD